MLYYLYLLKDTVSWLSWTRLFQYVTFRAAGAGLTGFVVAVLLGPRIIRWLRGLRVTDSITKMDSEQLDELHSRKKDTPTMGGLLIVGGAVMACLLWANWPGLFTSAPEVAATAAPEAQARAAARLEAARAGGFYAIMGIVVLVAMAGLGFLDDYVKLRGRKGLKLWTKLFCQVAVALGVALAVYYLLPIEDPHRGRVYFPFVSVRPGLGGPALCDFYLPLGAGIAGFAVMVMVGSSNAVNLADGLDGLAGGCAAIVGACFAALSYVAGNSVLCDHLLVPFVQGGGELAVCSAALAAACMGFLWYNCHPAEVFMGDTGSLPIGAFIGYTALVIRHELLLVLVGGVFVAEALSVLLQIASFRLLGRRVFRIAPLHHHFEFKGWQENKVVVRFWIVAIVLALASIATLKVR
jgi:phospho-N-acetylmuramoyl-pentapeptide-transferase